MRLCVPPSDRKLMLGGKKLCEVCWKEGKGKGKNLEPSSRLSKIKKHGPAVRLHRWLAHTLRSSWGKVLSDSSLLNYRSTAYP